jgi:hypothetical protein
MKTTLLTLCFLFVGMISIQAQDRTTVRANSIDISDNLDLRAVAHIFGEAADLVDFERRLNDPSNPISNLDLNNDNQVDYLRVIEVVENGTHLIIVQSVLGRDMFQDVATVEVERDRNNNVQVQVVGDVYMYGSNYIYEPIYIHRPIIFNTFWVRTYRPYFSPWFWGYYPNYFYTWNPWPIFRYRNHVNIFVNVNNTCHYVNHRRSTRAIAMHQNRRTNAYEIQHPNRSFSTRNNGINNRYELTQTRATRNDGIIANSSIRSIRNNQLSENSYTGTRNNGIRSNATQSSPRTRVNGSTRSEVMAINTPKRETRNTVYSGSNSASIESSTPSIRANASSSNSINSTPRNTPRTSAFNSGSSTSVPKVKSTPRSSSNQISTPRNTSTPKVKSTPRSSSSQISTPRNTSTPKVKSTPRPSSSQMSTPKSSPRSESTRTRSSTNSSRRG